MNICSSLCTLHCKTVVYATRQNNAPNLGHPSDPTYVEALLFIGPPISADKTYTNQLLYTTGLAEFDFFSLGHLNHPSCNFWRQQKVQCLASIFNPLCELNRSCFETEQTIWNRLDDCDCSSKLIRFVPASSWEGPGREKLVSRSFVRCPIANNVSETSMMQVTFTHCRIVLFSYFTR